MIGAVLFPRIRLFQLCLIKTLGVIDREGVLGACPFEVLLTVSAWTIEVYIDISVPLLLCPMSFSGVVGQAELT